MSETILNIATVVLGVVSVLFLLSRVFVQRVYWQGYNNGHKDAIDFAHNVIDNIVEDRQ